MYLPKSMSFVPAGKDLAVKLLILLKIKEPSHNETCEVTINIRSDVPQLIHSKYEFTPNLLLILSNHPLIIA
jgi:hypothetical protein